jgi:protein involved in temperature-dependent protein secretion
LRMGRETDWTDAAAGPVRGIGQRVLLCGEEDIAIMDIGELRFGA